MSAIHAHTQSLNEQLPGFQRAQFAFTAHVRDPDRFAKPDDIEDRRMAIYRELLINNVQNFLESGFPVLRSMIRDEEWQPLVRHFFAYHVSHSPYFTDISSEFVQYLATEKPTDLAPTWPFLPELAHYEWMELVALIADAESSLTSNVQNVEQQALQLSPLAWPLAYNFAVHKIGPESMPTAAEPTQLVVYRDADDNVEFMVLTGMTYWLLQAVSEQAMTLAQLADALHEQMPHMAVADLKNAMVPVVTDFIQRGLLIPV